MIEGREIEESAIMTSEAAGSNEQLVDRTLMLSRQLEPVETHYGRKASCCLMKRPSRYMSLMPRINLRDRRSVSCLCPVREVVLCSASDTTSFADRWLAGARSTRGAIRKRYCINARGYWVTGASFLQRKPSPLRTIRPFLDMVYHRHLHDI